ncbi:MAG: flagellar filament capping protein FliD [Anaerobiospirillum sp.]|nr:flagellar filament capping protein FliD [Anaerobiospirillum sp.]
MASMITSAGSASGMDFESIISAMVEAKSASISNTTTTRKAETELELSGVGKLKSALKTFQEAIEALTEGTGFNERKVTTDLTEENQYFTVSTEEDAANGNYNISVDQLAQSEKIAQKFDTGKTFTAGTLKFTVPGVKDENGNWTKDEHGVEIKERTFEIEVEDGDTLDSLRRKINNNDYGVTATILNTKDGQKLVIDSGFSGNDATFKIEGTGGMTDFNYDSTTNTAGKWDVTQHAQDAVIRVDGEEMRSNTNEFDNAISGLTITANKLSAKDENGDVITNSVAITADNDKVTEKMQNFVNAYNTLMSTMDDLYKHNTYTDGENNYDGGELAGDNMLRSLQNQLQNMMSSMGNGANGMNIYSMGFELESDGTISLDKTEFKEGLTDNFNALVNMLTGDDGLLTRFDETVEEYTKSAGILDKRSETLNMEVDRYEEEENENALYLEEYEENLRQRYAKLDTTIANYNNSLSYLQSALM